LNTSVPAIPTALPDVEVATTARRGSPLAVVCRADDEAPVTLSARGEELTGEWMTALGITGKAGEVQPGPVGSSVRWVAGVGDGAPRDWRTAGAALTKALNARIAMDAEAGRSADRTLQLELPSSVGPEEVADLVFGLLLGGYQYSVSTEAGPPTVRTIRLVTTDSTLDEPVRRAAVLAKATALARDLANTPSNVKDPAWLAKMATRTAGKVADVVVRDEKWLAAEGFGGVLAVGGGGAPPPPVGGG
jgi:leucyl aminopeptidase